MEETSTTTRYQDIATQVDIQIKLLNLLFCCFDNLMQDFFPKNIQIKRNRMGEVIRYKCRLVAQGFFQVFGEDYNQPCSFVENITSIRTALAISAQLGLPVRQMNVDTAFLNSPIKEDIWIRMPKGTPLQDNDDGIYK
jgi:Reverse transcriptase (RNA-dependent DNA polymerase)